MEPDIFMDRPSLSAPLADALIQLEMRGQLCWRVTRVLGSMLVFDFGARQSVATRRGGSVQVGGAELSVRNCFWTLTVPGFGRINSDRLNSDGVELLQRTFEGRVLTGCHRRGGRLYLNFQDGVNLGLDLTNRYDLDLDEEIAEVRTPMNHSISLSASGRFALGITDTRQPTQAAA